MKTTTTQKIEIIAGILILAAVAAHYGGLLSVTESYTYFHANDGNGNIMSENTRFDFFEKDGGNWVPGGSYTILADSQEGARLWLRSDTQYKAVPVWYDADGWASPDDWTLPSEQIFYGGGIDRTFVYESTSTPTPTPTPSPTPPPDDGKDGDITTNDMLVLGGVALFILLVYFAFRKNPPITPRRKK